MENSQLKQMQKIVDALMYDYEDYNDYLKLKTPCIQIEEDTPSYIGQKFVLVGDDTAIRPKGNLFFIDNFHYEVNEDELYTTEEIIDYYLGKNSAYGVIPTVGYESNQYIKGFLETLESLIDYTKYELENKQTNLENNFPNGDAPKMSDIKHCNKCGHDFLIANSKIFEDKIMCPTINCFSKPNEWSDVKISFEEL
jgi:hypothetical protein